MNDEEQEHEPREARQSKSLMMKSQRASAVLLYQRVRNEGPMRRPASPFTTDRNARVSTRGK